MKKQSIFKENFTNSIDNLANSAQILARRMLKKREGYIYLLQFNKRFKNAPHAFLEK